MGISFAFQTTCTLKNRTILKQWIKLVIENNNKKVGEIAYIFCSDEQLLEINKEFLNHDYYTDIITFDYSETDVVSGDMFISIDRIKDNAKILGVAYQEELHRVIIHGILHLLGNKDKTETESENMRKLEDDCLSVLSTFIKALLVQSCLIM
jgi:rRNA maturation RNase YbeY